MNFTAKGDAEKLAIHSAIAIFLSGIILFISLEIEPQFFSKFLKVVSLASFSAAVLSALLSIIKAVQIPKEWFHFSL